MEQQLEEKTEEKAVETPPTEIQEPEQEVEPEFFPGVLGGEIQPADKEPEIPTEDKTKEASPVKDVAETEDDKITKAVTSVLQEKAQETPATKVPKQEKEVDISQKRYQDTRNWATQVNQHNVQLQEQIQQQAQELQKNKQTLNQIVQGLKQEQIDIPEIESQPTYPDVQQPTQVQQQFTPEQQARAVQADWLRRLDSSMSLADSVHGQGSVDQYVNETDGLWTKMMQTHPQGDQLLDEVRSSEAPVLQMISQVKEWETRQKAGETAEKDKIAAIVAAVKKEIGIGEANGGAKKETLPTSLGSLRSATGGEKKTTEKEPELFPVFSGGSVG